MGCGHYWVSRCDLCGEIKIGDFVGEVKKIKKIPVSYGSAKGFVKFKGKLMIVCEKGIVEIIQKK